MFQRLAVFRGSFSLGAAEAICGADLDVLESLVVKNLLRPWGSGRLGILDTIGEYALEQFDQSPDAGAIHQRHAEFFLGLAESGNLNAAKLDVRKPMRHDIASGDQDNFRGAIAWAIMSGSVGLGLKLAFALEWFWVTNDPAEGMRWFARLLERPEAEAVHAETRADALRAYGSSTDIAGDDEAAERLYERSVALYEQLADEHGCAVLLHRLGIQAMRRMELERARELVEASHAIHERTGDRWGLTQTIGTLGAIARDARDDTQAHELISQSAALARHVGVPWWESGMLAELACLALNSGRVEEAEMRARDSLELAKQLEDRAGQVFGVGVLARVAVERGQRERAGRLWGAVADEDAVAPLGGWRRHREACEAGIREAAGAQFDRCYAEGRKLALADAVSLALMSADVDAENHLTDA